MQIQLFFFAAAIVEYRSCTFYASALWKDTLIYEGVGNTNVTIPSKNLTKKEQKKTRRLISSAVTPVDNDRQFRNGGVKRKDHPLWTAEIKTETEMQQPTIPTTSIPMKNINKKCTNNCNLK